MKIAGFLLALFWATATVAQPSGTVLINGATPVVNATNGYVAYNNNGVLGFEAGGGGTGCIISGGSAGNILYTDGSQNCLPDASASVVLGHLTLGASGSALGTLTLFGSSSGSASVTGGTTGTFTSASPWALSGVLTLTGASNALGTPLTLVGTNITGTAAGLTAGAVALAGITGMNATVQTDAANTPNAASGLLTYAIVGTSGATLGLLNANKTDSGNDTWSGGTLTMSGLTSGTVAANSYIGLDVSNHLVLGSGGGGGSVTWPTTADLVISNRTNTPAGLAPVNGDCVVGSGGAWTAGACSGSASSVTPGTTTVVGATAPCIIDNSTGTTMGCGALGANLALNSGTFNITQPVEAAQTVSFSVAAGDMGKTTPVNISGGGTITLSSSGAFSTVFGAGQVWIAENIGATADTITNSTGGTMFPAVATLQPGETLTLQSDGTALYASVAYGTSTGTGSNVRATSPTLVTPTLGVATATSVNGNTFTTGTYTLTGTAAKTLNFTNTLTLLRDR